MTNCQFCDIVLKSVVILMSFSEQLKIARKKKGYTQEQIADIMGITKSTYCGYETGKRQPDVTKIKQIANILGISGDFLLETGYKNSQSEFESLSEAEKDLIRIIRSVPTQRAEGLVSAIRAALDM